MISFFDKIYRIYINFLRIRKRNDEFVLDLHTELKEMNIKQNQH